MNKTFLFLFFLSTSNWEEAPWQTQNMLDGSYNPSVPELWIPHEELESVAGERDIWVSLFDLFPPLPDLG